MSLVDLLNSNALRVGLYVVAGACWLEAGRRIRARAGDRAAWFWLAGGAFLVILGLSREVQLGSWVTHEGRDFAKDHGWYPDRRPVQRRADIALAVVGAATIGCLVIFRQRLRVPAMPLALIVALVVFIAIRAISYHNVDQALYNHTWHGLRTNSVLEGLLLAAIAAVATRVVASPGSHGGAMETGSASPASLPDHHAPS